MEMNVKTVFFMTFALLFICSALGYSDELSDLKQKVEALEKSREQDKEKITELNDSVNELLNQPSANTVVSNALGKQTTVGGHFKFFLADQARGDVNDDSQHNSYSAGITELWIYINKTVTDWLQINVAPNVVVLAEATPALGSPISRPTSGGVDVDLDEAFMTVRLPNMYELKAGAFYPMFSEDYATKSWWHDQYHNNNGLVTLQAMQSTGVELYRNYDFESFSLPLSLGLFNGESRGVSQDTRFTDNNSAKTVMAHAGPEFFVSDGRLRLMGSAGYGRWDDQGDNDAYQWAAGAEYSKASVTLTGEYLYRWRENLPLTGGGTEDGEDKGWYIKAKYAHSSTLRFVLKYSDVDLWAVSSTRLLTDSYKEVSLAGGWWITDSSTIIPQVEYVDADRSSSSITLEYVRYTLGWRTTF